MAFNTASYLKHTESHKVNSPTRTCSINNDDRTSLNRLSRLYPSAQDHHSLYSSRLWWWDLSLMHRIDDRSEWNVGKSMAKSLNQTRITATYIFLEKSSPKFFSWILCRSWCGLPQNLRNWRPDGVVFGVTHLVPTKQSDVHSSRLKWSSDDQMSATIHLFEQLQHNEWEFYFE